MSKQTAYTLRPWTDVVEPHPDVRSGDLAMGTYAANLAKVAIESGGAEVYRDAESFFAATYFTEEMRELLADVWARLAGKPGDRVLQLRTPFGGGKTHTLLALYHLATSPQAAQGVPELKRHLRAGSGPRRGPLRRVPRSPAGPGGRGSAYPHALGRARLTSSGDGLPMTSCSSTARRGSLQAARSSGGCSA